MQIVDELKDCSTFRDSSKHTIEDFVRRTLSRPVLGDLPRSGRPKDKKASKRAKAERGRIKKAAVSEEDYWEPPLTMVQFAKAFDHARACGRSNDIVIRNGQFSDYRRVRAAGTAELIKQTRTMPTAEKYNVFYRAHWHRATAEEREGAERDPRLWHQRGQD